jgi:hypothetical protein
MMKNGMKTYTAIITDDEKVSISRDGIWATQGRLDKVCLARKEAHIIDADAPLGDEVYEALDEALTDAIERGETEASVTL